MLSSQHEMSLLLIAPSAALHALPGFDNRRAIPGNQAPIMCAESGVHAIGMLRVSRFDLIATESRLPDICPLEMIRTIRTSRPSQKWVLIGSDISADEEVDARMLGVAAIFDQMPAVEDLIALTRGMQQRPQTQPNSVERAYL